jgi:hypothetical protein
MLEIVKNLGIIGVMETLFFLGLLLVFIRYRSQESYGANSWAWFFFGLFLWSFKLASELELTTVTIPDTNYLSYSHTKEVFRFWALPWFWRTIHASSLLLAIIFLVIQKRSWGRIQL